MTANPEPHEATLEYWRRLNPQCTISEFPWRGRTAYSLSEAESAQCVANLRREGYFKTRPVIPLSDLRVLAQCIRTIVARGHPAAYALLYDEFYQMLGRLGPVLGPVLGPDYRLVAHGLEASLVPNADHAGGAAPHRDAPPGGRALGTDGTPALVKVWIPLTDATTLNSCVHVLPAHRDSAYTRAEDGPSSGRPLAVLPDVRAVPAAAGSILCWSAHLLHWDGRSSRLASEPRLSIAARFQSRRCPLLNPAGLAIPSAIPFDYRLHLVEEARGRAAALGGRSRSNVPGWRNPDAPVETPGIAVLPPARSA